MEIGKAAGMPEGGVQHLSQQVREYCGSQQSSWDTFGGSAASFAAGERVLWRSAEQLGGRWGECSIF